MFRTLYVIDGPIHKGNIFAFTEGETAIVGPNGCGKSLLAEYMAFLLFGSVALRGKVSDYKDLKVEGVVKIKNQKYIITRSTKECLIKNSSEEIICTGTKMCNLKIISLLGYDYGVYKMCNYAEQLDILGLGKMKPAERKAALDKTLGIGVVDKLVKYCTENGLKYKHEAEGVKIALQEPGESPSRPSNYQESADIAIEYQEQQKRIEEYEHFKETRPPIEPKEPIFPEGLEGLDSATMLDHLKEKTRMEADLKSFKEVNQPVFSEQELQDMLMTWNKYDDYQVYKDKTEFLKLDKDPVLNIESVQAYLKLLNEWDTYRLNLRSYELGKVKCPDCGKEFNPYNEAPKKPEFSTTWSREDLLAEMERIQKKEKLSTIPVVEETPKPEVSKIDIIKMQQEWVKWKDAQKYIPKLEYELGGMTYVSQENINRLQKYETELEVYKHIKYLYETENKIYSKQVEKFKYFNLEKERAILVNLGVDYNSCLQYEKDLQSYEIKLAEYNRLMKKITELTLQEDQYRKSAENLKEMKKKIKGYVLPSLQKVASLLLSEMSDGLFTDVKIDADFNILVEGREVCLFSGSEQAMINLALRLGLGQVLTHKAFSVFIGDEIDASMRDERAQLTADCLRKVSKYINQVILISHRDIEADNYIDLGKEN